MYRRHERLCLHDLLRNVNMVRFELITEQELDLDREFKCCSVPPKLSAGIEVISSMNLYQQFLLLLFLGEKRSLLPSLHQQHLSPMAKY